MIGRPVFEPLTGCPGFLVVIITSLDATEKVAYIICYTKRSNKRAIIMANRLYPVEPPYSQAVETLLSRYPKPNGYLLKLFRVFANSKRFLRKGVLDLLDRDSPLTMRHRELVILRTCANTDCEYEWGVHVAGFAEHVRFTEEQIKATRLETPDAACWNSEESTLLLAVDELCNSACLRPETRDRFQSLFTVEQQLEVFALCGNYHTVSFVANTAEIEGEPFGMRFPSALDKGD